MDLDRILTPQAVSNIGDQYAQLRNNGIAHREVASVVFDLTCEVGSTAFAGVFGSDALAQAPDNLAVVTGTSAQLVPILDDAGFASAAAQVRTWEAAPNELVVVVIHADGATVGPIRAMWLTG